MTKHAIPRHKRIHRLELDQYDDVISIKDRLQFITAGRVLLIFPRQPILKRKLDLVLIQREAARRDMRLAIICEDYDVIDHARELNISVFRTVEEARTKPWKVPKNKVFVDRSDRPKPEHDPYDIMSVGRTRRAQRKKSPIIFQIARGLIFGTTILLVLFGFYALLPSAQITITPASDELNITLNIIADPNLEDVLPESLRIPATIERSLQEGTATIQSSGRRPAENSLAEGIVTFTNQTDLAQFIPKGTQVQTSTVPPVIYLTQEDAVLPARTGSTVNVAIRAIEANQGLSGNQPPGAIDRVFGPLEGLITVTNRNATYGEGVREIAYVTAEDHERVFELAQIELLENARDNLRVSLPEGEFLIVPESVQIVEIRERIYSAEIDQPSENLSLTLKAIVQATLIDLSDAELVAIAMANSGRYTEGRILDLTSLKVSPRGTQTILDDGSVAFQMRVEGDMYADIDTEQVRERLTGLSVQEAREILEAEYLLDSRYPPIIETWPSFFQRLPIFPVRIQVELNYVR
ncbi:MAG: hypothetical protein CUN55_07370 [Phototrophicales bacterium]|nr:MAG: hypothetical protein CUN55_07370 [Phototrophicales bacterium]